jgi:transcriptional regulator with XRE-family HTH domain
MEVQPRTARRWGQATSAIVRSLAFEDAAAPMNQVALARRMGISQPRVSQVVRSLRNAGVELDHWVAQDTQRQLLDLYLAHHQPHATETHWFSLEDQLTQVRSVVEQAAARDMPVTVSADWGADRLAAWKVPTQTVVYASPAFNAAEMDALDFVPAANERQATLILRQTDDLSLLTHCLGTSDLPLCHPVQMIWDLVHLGGADRVEAAGRLADALADLQKR